MAGKHVKESRKVALMYVALTQKAAHQRRRKNKERPSGYLVPKHQAITSPETIAKERMVDPDFFVFDTTPTDLVDALERADYYDDLRERSE